MAGLRVMTSGQTWIHPSSSPCTGARRTAKFYTLQEVSPFSLSWEQAALSSAVPLKSEHFRIRIGQSERTRAVRKLPTKREVIDTAFDLEPSKCYLLRADKNSPEFSLTQEN